MTIDYKSFQNELVEIRRHFHMHPETAFNEFETTAFIKSYLEKNGYKAETIQPTGCTALLMKDPRLPTVILRAEMDAVPIEEKTGLPFASQNKNAMHACGHDANMAVALVLSSLLKNTQESLKCNVRFIFEPAEEIGGGAEIMLKNHVLESPKADAFIMFHFTNKDTFGVEVNKDIATAAIGKLDVRLYGASTHWARKDSGKDAVLAAAYLLTQLDAINHEYKSPYPFCVGIGKINGGTSANVMADYAELNGNVRCCSMEDYDALSKLINTKCSEVQEKTGVKISAEISPDPITPIVNDPQMVKKAAEVGKKVYGDNFFLTDKLYLAGDNACLYFNHVPGIFMVFRSQLPDGKPLHSAQMTLNEEHFYKALEMLHTYITDLF